MTNNDLKTKIQKLETELAELQAENEVLREQNLAAVKEWKQREAEVRREMVEKVRGFNGNYHEDVFIPPTSYQIKAATDLLVKYGFSPDALYANWARMIIKNIVDALRSEYRDENENHE